MNFILMGRCTPNSMSINAPKDATIHSLFYLQTALHVSGGFSTPSSVAQITVSTASGTTATCRFCGGVSTCQREVETTID